MYWTKKLDAGVSKGQVVVDMIAAVTAFNEAGESGKQSKRLFENKVKIGLYYAVDMACNVVNTTVLPIVTDTDESVESARLHIRRLMGAGMI